MVEKMHAICPQCEVVLKGQESFCANCGSSVAHLLEKICKSCGVLNRATDAIYCGECGKPVADGNKKTSIKTDNSKTLSTEKSQTTKSNSPPTIIFCPNCGEKNNPASRFCKNDGHLLKPNQESEKRPSTVSPQPEISKYLVPFYDDLKPKIQGWYTNKGWYTNISSIIIKKTTLIVNFYEDKKTKIQGWCTNKGWYRNLSSINAKRAILLFVPALLLTTILGSFLFTADSDSGLHEKNNPYEIDELGIGTTIIEPADNNQQVSFLGVDPTDFPTYTNSRNIVSNGNPSTIDSKSLSSNNNSPKNNDSHVWNQDMQTFAHNDTQGTEGGISQQYKANIEISHKGESSNTAQKPAEVKKTKKNNQLKLKRKIKSNLLKGGFTGVNVDIINDDTIVLKGVVSSNKDKKRMIYTVRKIDGARQIKDKVFIVE